MPISSRGVLVTVLVWPSKAMVVMSIRDVSDSGSDVFVEQPEKLRLAKRFEQRADFLRRDLRDGTALGLDVSLAVPEHGPSPATVTYRTGTTPKHGVRSKLIFSEDQFLMSGKATCWKGGRRWAAYRVAMRVRTGGDLNDRVRPDPLWVLAVSSMARSSS